MKDRSWSHQWGVDSLEVAGPLGRTLAEALAAYRIVAVGHNNRQVGFGSWDRMFLVAVGLEATT